MRAPDSFGVAERGEARLTFISMTMYLRLLEFRASEPSRFKSGFHRPAHHINELFLHFLGNRVTLDGSSKISILCGPRLTEPQYQQVLGCSVCFLESFDFLAFDLGTARERSELFLTAIETVLSDIAARSGVSAGAIQAAAQLVRGRDFCCSMEVKRLSLSLGSMRLQVFRNLSDELGEAWSLRLVPRGGEPIAELPIGPRPGYIDGRSAYRSTSVEDRIFTVWGSFGRVAATVDLSPFVGTA